MKITMTKLAQYIAKQEGKKKNVDIAQITEILGILSDMIVLEIDNRKTSSIVNALIKNGVRRQEKK
jgi:hypothetical protein